MCYRQIVAAVTETLALTPAIDQAIADHGGFSAAFIS
jgi:hypothetical protein